MITKTLAAPALAARHPDSAEAPEPRPVPVVTFPDRFDALGALTSVEAALCAVKEANGRPALAALAELKVLRVFAPLLDRLLERQRAESPERFELVTARELSALAARFEREAPFERAILANTIEALAAPLRARGELDASAEHLFATLVAETAHSPQALLERARLFQPVLLVTAKLISQPEVYEQAMAELVVALERLDPKDRVLFDEVAYRAMHPVVFDRALARRPDAREALGANFERLKALVRRAPADGLDWE